MGAVMKVSELEEQQGRNIYHYPSIYLLIPCWPEKKKFDHFVSSMKFGSIMITRLASFANICIFGNS